MLVIHSHSLILMFGVNTDNNMTQINKILGELSSTITHSEFKTISQIKSICLTESPDTLINKINFYKEFLKNNNLSWETAHLCSGISE